MPTEARRAVVVGAGLAGLVAADELMRGGWEVEVLEARDRVGGRTWSCSLDGATIEMGAEFILPGNTEVEKLAGNLGIGLIDKGMSYGHREPRGGPEATEAGLAAGASAIREALASLAAEVSARELVGSLGLDDGVREAILARVEISAASPADLVTAADLAGVAKVDNEPSPGLDGGNQGLALGLARRLGERVRTGEAVESVAWTASGVTVRSATGRIVDGDRCVVAAPASVIGRITFEPALPSVKREALERTRYGHAAKLFVPLSEPAPPGSVMNVPERWWCWTEVDTAGDPVPVVSCFAGSAPALELLRVRKGPERWLESLAAMRPDLALRPDSAVLSTWDDDPWVGAAYSVSPSKELSAALAAPVGPIEFAGEHTAGDFAALMEGAIRSGHRVAARLLGGRRGGDRS